VRILTDAADSGHQEPLISKLGVTRSPKMSGKDPADSSELFLEESLLHQSKKLQLIPRTRRLAGPWAGPYAKAAPERAVAKAPVWYTEYPRSILCRTSETPLDVMGSERLWDCLQSIGFRAMHTGPIFVAGGIGARKRGQIRRSSSVDGGFDPIGLGIDSFFGSDEQYRKMVAVAEARGASIIGDIIPGHTGKGGDFWRALKGDDEAAGLYLLKVIRKEDWHLLPKITDEWQVRPLNKLQVRALKHKGYIPGSPERAMFGARSTGWSTTGVVKGFDGVERRWVYLHIFKPGQPTLNLLDPSGAAEQVVYAQLARLLVNWRADDPNYGESPGLGAAGVRLDATPFLGIEALYLPSQIQRRGGKDTWSEAHPLSIQASNKLAWLARCLGGFSFQELNMGIEEILLFSKHGPDLAYDFVTRTAYLHALLTGKTDVLYTMYDLLQQHSVDTGSLIHALQNHDEITYELMEFHLHPNEYFQSGTRHYTGASLRQTILRELNERGAGRCAPYNRISGNGLCTTLVGLLAAALGVDSALKIAEAKGAIQQGHLVASAFNALQPGVFAASGWDLAGAVPLSEEQLRSIPVEYVGENSDRDDRWVNRGAYDLLGGATADCSAGKIPRAAALYGSLPDQLQDPGSFASKLKSILAAREETKVYAGKLLGVPNLGNNALFAMATTLAGRAGREPRIVITILNFSHRAEAAEFDLGHWSGKPPSIDIRGFGGGRLVDLLEPGPAEVRLKQGRANFEMGPWEYRFVELVGRTKRG